MKANSVPNTTNVTTTLMNNQRNFSVGDYSDEDNSLEVDDKKIKDAGKDVGKGEKGGSVSKLKPKEETKLNDIFNKEPEVKLDNSEFKMWKKTENIGSSEPGDMSSYYKDPSFRPPVSNSRNMSSMQNSNSMSESINEDFQEREAAPESLDKPRNKKFVLPQI